MIAPTEKTAAFTSGDWAGTLPDTWYTDPSLFELELQSIFRRSWQYAGIETEVAEPGAFITAEAGIVPVLLARGDDAELRAFANVCRHRGSILCPEQSGKRKSFQCGYHAWTYGLDGSLLAAPGSKEEDDFRAADLSLTRVGLSRMGPFLFVNPADEYPSFEAVIGELPELMRRSGVCLDAVRPRIRRTFEIRANWKAVVDNYLECYHCPVAHPGFCEVIDVRDYAVDEYEFFSVQTAPARASKKGVQPAGPVAGGLYAYLWPNFAINIYPGAGNVSVNLFVPAGVDRTVAIFDYCFVESVTDAEAQKFAEFVDQVQREDTALCESVQRGLRSGVLGRGRLMLSRERALRHFHHLVVDAMRESDAPRNWAGHPHPSQSPI